MKRTTIFAMLAALGLLFTAQHAFADGTQANQLIDNTASVSYSVSGTPQTPIESSPTGNSTPGTGNGTATQFMVDQKIDLLVTTTNLSAVGIAPGGTAATSFTVKNEGNETQDVLLSAVAQANGIVGPFGGTDAFDNDGAFTILFYEDSGGAGAGVFDATDTAVTYLDEMTNGETRIVHMVIQAPSAQTQNQVAVYALKGTVLAGGGVGSQGAALTSDVDGDNTNQITGLDIIFADSAGTDDTTGNYDAEHSARSEYVVTTATLTVTKTAAVYDTLSGLPTDTYAIPGAIMTYTITIANTGAVSATGVTIVDEIPANTSFYVTSGPTGGDGSGTQYEYDNTAPFDPASPSWGYTPVADLTTGADTNVTAIKVKAPDVAAGGSTAVTFKVRID